MGIKGAYERCLEQIAYKHWLKNKNRSSEENWKYAEKLMKYITKRITLVRKIVEKYYDKS